VHHRSPPFGHVTGATPATNSQRRHHQMVQCSRLNRIRVVPQPLKHRIIDSMVDLWAIAIDDIIFDPVNRFDLVLPVW
jgi:hypothetical protein